MMAAWGVGPIVYCIPWVDILGCRYTDPHMDHETQLWSGCMDVGCDWYSVGSTS